MPINREVILQPDCAFIQPQWDKYDIASADIRFDAVDCVSGADGESTMTEVTLWFEHQDERGEPIYADAATLNVPIDSSVSNAARDIANEADAGDPIRRDELHDQLNEQVFNCRGMVDGECGALGKTAVTCAILAVMSKTV